MVAVAGVMIAVAGVVVAVAGLGTAWRRGAKGALSVENSDN